MDCCPSGSSVHGLFQARILERVAISFSREIPTSYKYLLSLLCAHFWETEEALDLIPTLKEIMLDLILFKSTYSLYISSCCGLGGLGVSEENEVSQPGAPDTSQPVEEESCLQKTTLL